MLVTVHEARLPRAADAYAVVTVGETKRKTDTRHKTQEPSWEAGLVFRDAPANSQLRVAIYQRNRVRADALLAQKELPPDGLETEEGVWVALESEHAGEWAVRLSTTTAPAPAPAPAAAAGAQAEADQPPPAQAAQARPTLLHVCVVSAQGLKGTDGRGPNKTSDPLVILSLNGQTHRTSIKPKTLTPEWNERFVFQLSADKPDQLQLTVEDDDLMINDFLGRGSVPDACAAALASPGQPLTVQLSTRGMHPEPAGTLVLELEAEVSDADVSQFTQGEADDVYESADAEEEEDAMNRETDEERAAREAEEAAMLEALEGMSLESGDYQVQVHVIEARDLHAEDANGSADPVVYVEAFGQKFNTRVHQNTTSCVFDELFFFNLRGADKDDLETGSISVRVFDADGPAVRKDLIGMFQVDFSTVYFRSDHELYRQWVALIDDENPADEGVQGYLLLSVAVLGPGDKPVVHDLAKELEAEKAAVKKAGGLQSLVLMPPRITRQTEFLVVTVHEAADLPAMDTSLIGRSPSIDAYVQVRFASAAKPCKSKVVEATGAGGTMRAIFNQELWVPVTTPTMANNIKISLWDDDLASDSLVATAQRFLYNHVSQFPHAHTKVWCNLYGAPMHIPSLSNGGGHVKTHMNKHPNAGSHYRGRLLLSLRTEPHPRKSEPETPHTKRGKPAVPPPPTVDLELRALVFAGSEVPQFTSIKRLGANSRMSVKITCGRYVLWTDRAMNQGGMCRWHELKHQVIKLPADEEQMPDVIIYLVKGTGSDALHVCFARIKAKDLIQRGFDAEPYWQLMHEDAAIDALPDTAFPGSVLMRLALGAPGHPAWDPNEGRQLDHYRLNVHVYQGRNLPAADASGLLDPYLKIHVAGQEHKIRRKRQTCDPLYYETAAFDVELPDGPYMPQVTVQVFDYDRWDKDDYVGAVRFPTHRAFRNDRHNPAPLPDPQWYPLFFAAPGDSTGELLLSFELIRKDAKTDPVPPAPSIQPECDRKFVEITALGLRSLAPYMFVAVQMPFAEFNIGNPDVAAPVKTEASKTPSGANPNFLQRIFIPADIPRNALFAPRLQLTVKDTRLGGYQKPTIGVASIPLASKMPLSCGRRNPDYEPPGPQLAVESSPSASPDSSPSGSPVATRLRRSSSINPHLTGSPDPAAPLRRRGSINPNLAAPGLMMSFDDEPPPLETSQGVLETKEPEPGSDQGVGLHIALDVNDLSSIPPDSESDDDDDEPEYLKHRHRVPDILEMDFGKPPFELYALYRGQQQGRKPFGMGDDGAGQQKVAGYFKGVIRIVDSTDVAPLFDLKQLLTPTPFEIRLYVMRGIHLMGLDDDGKSDPYLKVKLGKKEFNGKQNYLPSTTEADFFTRVDFTTSLPGEARLEIEVWDYDRFSGDDLIGATTIDLEDRWFESRWHTLGQAAASDTRYAPKPVELRPLWTASSTTAQGTLELWLDILSVPEAGKFPPIDITPPPPEPFELRVIVWKTKKIPAGDQFTGMTDAYVRCWLEGERPQDTDVHWRCSDGNASFNWRMKFPVMLPLDGEGQSYLHFQVWDSDVLYNDCLADTTIDIDSAFRRAHRSKNIFNMFSKRAQPGPKPKEAPGGSAAATAAAAAPEQPPPTADPDIEAGEDRPLLAPPAKDGYLALSDSEGDEPAKPKSKKKKKKKHEHHTSLLDSIKTALGFGPEPEDSSWLELNKTDPATGEVTNCGSLLISLEVLPADMAEQRPAGQGRSEPNSFPELPKPTGRLNLAKMWNPMYFLKAMLGPGIVNSCLCCICCMGITTALVFGAPFLNTMFMWFGAIPGGFYILGGIIVTALLCCCSFLFKLRSACGGGGGGGSGSDSDPDDEDDE